MRGHTLSGFFILLALAGFLAIAWFIHVVQLSPIVGGGQPYLPMQQIHIGTTALTVELATTNAQRQEGLSNRPSLANGQGMLFVFDQPGNWGFWMKDMRFPLDIVWAAADGTIVTVEANLSPSTYPQAFYPQAPALYVLEVPAGYAAAHGIAPGAKIVLQ